MYIVAEKLHKKSVAKTGATDFSEIVHFQMSTFDVRKGERDVCPTFYTLKDNIVLILRAFMIHSDTPVCHAALVLLIVSYIITWL